MGGFWQGMESRCEGCVDYEEECYFSSLSCKVCIRNPYIKENDDRIFITRDFLIQPPEDLYLSKINPDRNSIGFVIRFGKLIIMRANTLN